MHLVRILRCLYFLASSNLSAAVVHKVIETKISRDSIRRNIVATVGGNVVYHIKLIYVPPNTQALIYHILMILMATFLFIIRLRLLRLFRILPLTIFFLLVILVDV